MLEKRVFVRWGTGEPRGFGTVVGYTDQPTYTVNMDSGGQIHWIAALCSPHICDGRAFCADCGEPIAAAVQQP